MRPTPDTNTSQDSGQTPSATPRSAEAPKDQPRWATLLSEILAPWVCAALLPPIVGATTAHPWWKGALLGLLAATFSAALPYLLILRGVRRGRLTDRHVSRRSDRPVFLAVVVALVVASLVIIRSLGAPQALISLIIVMISCASLGMIVSLWWKLSMHTIVFSASILILAMTLSPWTIALTPALIALAFARVRLRAHTPAQTAAGAALGAATAALIFAV